MPPEGPEAVLHLGHLPPSRHFPPENNEVSFPILARLSTLNRAIAPLYIKKVFVLELPSLPGRLCLGGRSPLPLPPQFPSFPLELATA